MATESSNPTEMMTINQLKKAALEQRKVDLQERTLAFLKKHEEHRQEIEHLHFLQAELEEDEGSGAETDDEKDKTVSMFNYSFFEEVDHDQYWNIDIDQYDPKKNPELPEMEMEPPSIVETEEQKKEFQTLLEFARHGKKVGEIKEKIDGVIKKTTFFQGSDIFKKVNQYVKSNDILITEEDVERYLTEDSSFHFPAPTMLYANGVALSNEPLESRIEEGKNSDYSVKFKFTLTPSVPVVRRRSLVFGKNPPKTKKRLSMKGAYILLDERRYVVGYEFDHNFRGEPVESPILGRHEWDFRGFDYENAFLEKPAEYMSAMLIYRLLKQGYVFFPSHPHLKNMKVSNLKQFQSKIREDGLIKLEELIPENGSDQTFLFTQPGLTYDLPCLSTWDDQIKLDTSVPTFKIIFGKQNSFKVIGYHIEQNNDSDNNDSDN
jgi:hypothetical protein